MVIQCKLWGKRMNEDTVNMILTILSTLAGIWYVIFVSYGLTSFLDSVS